MFHPNENLSTVDHRKGPLIGIVINNKDPLQLRRVQVKIEGVLEGSDATNTPWFSPEPSGLGSRTDYGVFDAVPEINTAVEITLVNGDLRSGKYKACQDMSVDSSQLRLFGEDYPATSGHCDAKGTFHRKNTHKGYEEDMHQSGVYCQKDAGGNLHVYIPGNIFIHVKGGMALQVDKDLFAKCLGMLGLTAVKDAGIAGNNVEVLSQEGISLQSESDAFIESNTGVKFGVKDAAESGVSSAIAKVDTRHAEVKELQQAVLLSGEVAKDALDVHSGSLLGTRS